MLPILLFQTVSFILNLVIILFVIYYFMRLRTREKEIEKKETKIDTNYHQIVDDAQARERKILADATVEAQRIITDAHYVNTSSKQTIDQGLSTMITTIEKDAVATAREFKASYATSLQQIAQTSLGDFQTITKHMQADLQQEMQQFNQSLLPKLETELDAYKKERLKEAEQTVTHVVAEVAQKVLNKSLTLEDHHQLLLDALEKAKKEGVFT